jgi:hypothetical protein
MLLRAVGIVALMIALSASAVTASDTQALVVECGTQIRYEQKLRADGYNADASAPACPDDGPCDNPSTRDSFIPEPWGAITVVRLAIHIVAHTDDSFPFTTPETVSGAIDLVNAHYASSKIRFEYVLDQINSSEWRVLSEDEIDPMKIATATDPTEWLNVWLTGVNFGYSFGTYPFESDALEATGGIVMGQNHWGENHSAFAHEIGHCLGLWHNFYGVSEVTACGPCYEAVDADERDLLGDRCSDTPPLPAYYECNDASGTDPCSGLEWGETQPENIMGYAPSNCRTWFTPQQRGRMQCWLDDVLTGWIVGPIPCCEGRVGDANGLGGDEPTIGDVSVLIDAKFITSECDGIIICAAEGDLNQSGGIEPECDDITIGDISVLIDYLFINGPSDVTLPDCL